MRRVCLQSEADVGENKVPELPRILGPEIAFDGFGPALDGHVDLLGLGELSENVFFRLVDGILDDRSRSGLAAGVRAARTSELQGLTINREGERFARANVQPPRRLQRFVAHFEVIARAPVPL